MENYVRLRKLLIICSIAAMSSVPAFADDGETMNLSNNATTPETVITPATESTGNTLVANQAESAASTNNKIEEKDFASAWGVGVQVGTLGIGLNVAHALYDDYLDIRGQYNYLSYNSDINGSQFKMNFNTLGALLDYKPFGGSFRFTGGLYYDGRTFEAAGGSLGGSITYAPIAPYLGIGIGSFGATTVDKKGFLVNFDAGVMFSKATVNASSDPQTTQDLNNALASFPYYPVISLGVGYRF